MYEKKKYLVGNVINILVLSIYFIFSVQLQGGSCFSSYSILRIGPPLEIRSVPGNNIRLYSIEYTRKCTCNIIIVY